jgi:ATP-dependent HslUV protease subunit HslV
MSKKTQFRSTTVLGVIHNGECAMGADGQATMGDVVLKHNAKKVRTLYGSTILAGFAGATADAFTLFDLFEKKLEEFRGNELRAAVEMAKDWRTDRYLRRLEALLAVATINRLLLISGTGDVIEPDDNIIAVGSGGSYALAAARALVEHAPQLSAREIVESSLNIAGDLCVYTNKQISILELPDPSRQ